jgi:hypothetical protein
MLGVVGRSSKDGAWYTMYTHAGHGNTIKIIYHVLGSSPVYSLSIVPKAWLT